MGLYSLIETWIKIMTQRCRNEYMTNCHVTEVGKHISNSLLDLVEGPPMATKDYTTVELMSMGIVGLYKE